MVQASEGLGHPQYLYTLGIYPKLEKVSAVPSKRMLRRAYRGNKEIQNLLGEVYAGATYDPNAYVPRACVWFAIASGCELGEPLELERRYFNWRSPGGWGSPERAYRLLTAVLTDEEIGLARQEYVKIKRGMSFLGRMRLDELLGCRQRSLRETSRTDAADRPAASISSSSYFAYSSP